MTISSAGQPISLKSKQKKYHVSIMRVFMTKQVFYYTTINSLIRFIEISGFTGHINKQINAQTSNREEILADFKTNL